LNFKEILELIDKVADRGIAVVEVERAGTRVRIEGKSAQPPVSAARAADSGAGAAVGGGVPAANFMAHAQVPAVSPVDSEAGLHIVTSPIVGTFYRSANPESDVFVNVGDRVTKGKVLCIIEAMKLMNEIEADVDGVVERIYPQNGQPIEYGEKLFAVKL
jgi:acetyl-CoA carboxylase biotin carboxyl carrier protein